MTADELKARTKAFALDAIRMTRSLSQDDATRVMSKQLIRCATSVGANYRAACLAKSPADMISKLKVAEEEADESQYWLQLLSESASASPTQTAPLEREAGELLRIMAASVTTLKARNPRPR